MPKRKYTVTEKVLAANRRNLEKARKIDPNFRFRTTEKKLAACRANIQKALAVQRAASLTPDGYPQKSEIGSQKSETGNAKLETGNMQFETGNLKLEIGNSQAAVRNSESGILNTEPETLNLESGILNFESEVSNPQSPKTLNLESGILNFESEISNTAKPRWPDSPAYGACFTHGLYAASLHRSAPLAGESPQAFDAHVAGFLAALAPQSRTERRLARGIAEVVWRRLRVYRGQARWERLSAACGGVPVNPEDLEKAYFKNLKEYHKVLAQIEPPPPPGSGEMGGLRALPNRNCVSGLIPNDTTIPPPGKSNEAPKESVAARRERDSGGEDRSPSEESEAGDGP